MEQENQRLDGNTFIRSDHVLSMLLLLLLLLLLIINLPQHQRQDT
jgi:hypothetical protein